MAYVSYCEQDKNHIYVNILRNVVLTALILGLQSGIGIGLCTFAYMIPSLGVAFQVAKTNIIYSVILLLAFGIGHIIIIVAAGTLSGKVQQYLNCIGKSKAMTYIKRTCGAWSYLAEYIGFAIFIKNIAITFKNILVFSVMKMLQLKKELICELIRNLKQRDFRNSVYYTGCIKKI